MKFFQGVPLVMVLALLCLPLAPTAIAAESAPSGQAGLSASVQNGNRPGFFEWWVAQVTLKGNASPSEIEQRIADYVAWLDQNASKYADLTDLLLASAADPNAFQHATTAMVGFSCTGSAECAATLRSNLNRCVADFSDCVTEINQRRKEGSLPCDPQVDHNCIFSCTRNGCQCFAGGLGDWWGCRCGEKPPVVVPCGERFGEVICVCN